MSAHEKPGKRKPAKGKSETAPEQLRPGLERRLRAATSEKNQPSSKSVTFKELTGTVNSAKNKFTLAALEIIEYAHIEKTKSVDEAIKLAQAVEKEIAAQLRQDDLVANMGAGKFTVYLPETAKVESTMVLERLSRHICRKNSKRPSAPQISLLFKLLPAETMAEDNRHDQEGQQFSQWLSRYKSAPVTAKDAASKTVTASDLWKDSRKVLIKRFDFPSRGTQTSKIRITEILLQIQENGLPLFPRLFDFHIGDNYLCIALDPSSDCPKEHFTSPRSVHSLLISVCDLFLQLDAFSVPPPAISALKFKISQGENETVYASLEDYVIEALLANSDDEQTAYTKAVESFSKLISKLSEKVGADECFSESQKQLKNITSRRNLSNLLQKIRATLKRHEERLRRIEAIGLEGSK